MVIVPNQLLLAWLQPKNVSNAQITLSAPVVTNVISQLISVITASNMLIVHKVRYAYKTNVPSDVSLIEIVVPIIFAQTTSAFQVVELMPIVQIIKNVSIKNVLSVAQVQAIVMIAPVGK